MILDYFLEFDKFGPGCGMRVISVANNFWASRPNFHNAFANWSSQKYTECGWQFQNNALSSTVRVEPRYLL